jgi:hypothetical protein
VGDRYAACKPAGPADVSGTGDFMVAVNTGMSTQDLKKLLALARKKPVSCALAAANRETAGRCLILLNKVKPPKAVLAQLKGQFPELKGPCFGTVKVDVDTDPKLAAFVVNKKIAGMSRQLVKSLKGTGFTKVSIETRPPE